MKVSEHETCSLRGDVLASLVPDLTNPSEDRFQLICTGLAHREESLLNCDKYVRTTAFTSRKDSLLNVFGSVDQTLPVFESGTYGTSLQYRAWGTGLVGSRKGVVFSLLSVYCVMV